MGGVGEVAATIGVKPAVLDEGAQGGHARPVALDEQLAELTVPRSGPCSEIWFEPHARAPRPGGPDLGERVAAVGGTVVHEALVPEIAYQGALIDIPAATSPDLRGAVTSRWHSPTR
jgi:hypothetical protein